MGHGEIENYTNLPENLHLCGNGNLMIYIECCSGAVFGAPEKSWVCSPFSMGALKHAYNYRRDRGFGLPFGCRVRTSALLDGPNAEKLTSWKTSAWNYRSFLTLRVGSEKNRGTENSLKCGHQAAVLRSTLLHAERIQHLRRATESDHPVLLTDGESRKNRRNKPVLSPRQAVRWMPGHLKQKVSVSSFMEELPSPRPPYR